MFRNRPNRLFERFRDHADGEALGTLFDETAPRLFKFACHLVREPTVAEDLVQATFLVAVAHPEKFDGSGPVEGWLYGILWREAAKARRYAARRPDALESEPSVEAEPLKALLSEEIRASIASVVARLPDRHREVLEPFLSGDKRPEEIALALGRAPSAVRTQIHRALQRLRRALPRELAGLPVLVGAPMRGLDRIRSEILRSANVAPHASASGAAAGVKLALGGIATTKTVLSVIVALVALWAAWMTWPWVSSVDLRVETASVSSGSPEKLESPPLLQESSQRSDSRSLAPVGSDPVEPGSSEDPGTIGLRVVDVSGQPVRGAKLSCAFGTSERGPAARDPRIYAVTADEGTCTIVLPPWAPSGTIHIEAHADGFTPQEGDWTFKNGVTVRLSPAVTLTGRVIEADTGTSAIGAELLLSAENSKFRATTTTSNTGAYVIEGAPAGRKVYLSVKDTRREYPRVVESFTIDPQAPAPHDVALQPGIRVEGQVVDLLTDAPLSGVSLTFNGDACGESTASGAILAFVPASVRAAQLRFHLPGYCVYRWDEFRPGISDRSPFVIRMLPSAGVEGIAVDDGGAPLEGVRISVSGVPALNVPSGNSVQPPEWTWLSKLPEGVVIEHTEPFISLLTDKSGRFRCNGLIPASDEVEVYASAEGMHSTKDLVALRTPGEWKQVRLVLSHAPLDTGTVRGHLRFNGRPCAGKIEWRNGSESGEGSANIRGEYLLDRVAPGDVTLTSTPQSLEVFRRAPDYELGIQPETLTIRALEEATHEIDVRCPMSTITGHVRSASGTAQNAGVVLTTTDRAHLWISQAVHGDAEFRFEVPLVPREYTLRASAGGAVQEREHVHPGDHNIDLVIGPHGRLRVRAFDREDHSLISPLDAWLRPTGSQDYIRDPELGGSRDDGFRTISLPTGTYDVSLHCDERGYAPTTLNDVRIEDGKDAEREVQFEKGLDLQLQLGEGSADLSPDAQLYVIEAEWEAQVSFVGASGRMEIRAQGDAQSIDLSTRRASFGADRHAHIGGLRAGKYRLKCHPPSLALEPATLLVSTSSASPITIDVHVP